MQQVKKLRDADSELDAEGVTIIGVSTDPVAKQRAFSDRYRLPFDLLSDEEGTIADALGVVRLEDGRCSRETFMFRNGRMIWHDPSVYPANQAEDVLRVIRTVKRGERKAARE